jgi:glycosyltransferase involved in cell wall biosynthesis
MADISVLILTYNERVHIERVVRSAQQFARAVFVVDSDSNDGTVELARSLGAQVFCHTWENNHARQVNWAIDNLPIETEWVMRLDADEIVSAPLADEIERSLTAMPSSVSGIVLKRRQVFMGRALRWGGTYPICLLRIWRRGQGRCEDRWMDEHMVVTSGETRQLEHDLEDRNLNDLRWWTAKEANYALREAADTLLARDGGSQDQTAPQDPRSRRKRQLKVHLYRRIPIFLRPAAYFGYRYVVRLGLLDGVPGLVWHVLQGFWYRFLVDSIIYDIERRAKEGGKSVVEVIEDGYGLKVRPVAS